jgi:hypothetical protein
MFYEQSTWHLVRLIMYHMLKEANLGAAKLPKPMETDGAESATPLPQTLVRIPVQTIQAAAETREDDSGIK